MKAILSKEDEERRKAEGKYLRSVTNEAKFIVESRCRSAERRSFEHSPALLRESLYRNPYKFQGRLKVRGKITAEQTLLIRPSASATII